MNSKGAVFALLFAGAGSLHAQETPEPHAWAGLDGFIVLLQQNGRVLGSEPNPLLISKPEESWIIVMGEAPEDPDFVKRLRTFMIAGGRVLVASDRRSMAPVFKGLKVKLREDSILVGDIRDAYQGYRDCPIVREFRQHAIFKGVRELIFNRPAAFNPPIAEPLAWLPPDSRRRIGVCICEVEEAILISDHSLFINVMLAHESHAQFAVNLIRYADRRHVTLLYDGRCIDASSLPSNMPVTISPTAMLAMMNPALRKLETSGVLHRLVRRFLPAILGVITIVGFAVLAVAPFRRKGRLVAALAPAGPCVQIDTPELRPNLRGAAQEFVRAWWDDWSRERGLPETAGGSGGGFRFGAGGLKSWILGWRLERILRWRSRAPYLVTLRRFRRLVGVCASFNAIQGVQWNAK